jgi:hypothetical protein
MNEESTELRRGNAQNDSFIIILIEMKALTAPEYFTG